MKTLVLSAVLAAGLVVIGLLWGGRRGTSSPDSLGVSRGVLQGANLLLVTIDTLRADALGCYGSRESETPRIDRLAREGVRFAAAFAHATTTLPSHSSILTGRYPFAHGVHDNGSFRLDPEQVTLAEMLKAKGYRTGAFVGAFVLDARFGLSQGFDLYDDFYGERTHFTDFNFTERRAPDVLKATRTWLGEPSAHLLLGVGPQRPIQGKPSQPFFVWIHLFDPHVPYDPPSPYRERHPGKPYLGEVEATDAALGTFLSELGAAGQLDNTLVALTADHGESLGEHGETTHGTFAYNATLRVPLILWSPRALEPTVFSHPVGHVDLTATLLSLLGVEPGAGVQGRDLCTASPEPRRALYFEALSPYLTENLAPLTGVVSGAYKFIDLPIPELYDLTADPEEKNNLFDKEKGKARELQAQLKQMSGPAGAKLSQVDPALEKKLLSMGYLGARPRGKTKVYTADDDPKTQIALVELHRNAMERFASGSAEEAITRLEQVIARRPDWIQAYVDLAGILLEVGRPRESISLLRKASSLEPDDAWVLGRLGNTLSDVGALEEGLAVLKRAAEKAPGDADIAKALGVTYAKLGKLVEACRELERALELDPSSASTYSNLGSLYLQQKKLGEAREAFQRALALAPDLALAHEGLGAVYIETGKPEEALKAWTEAVRWAPGNFDTVYNLGMLLVQLKRPLDALPYLERFAREAPAPYADDRPKVERLVSEIRSRARM